MANLIDSPSVIAVRVVALEQWNITRGIVEGERFSVRPFLSHSPFEHGTDCFQAVVRPFGESKFPVPQNLDCVRRHPRYGHVAEEPWRIRCYGFIKRRFQNPT